MREATFDASVVALPSVAPFVSRPMILTIRASRDPTTRSLERNGHAVVGMYRSFCPGNCTYGGSTPMMRWALSFIVMNRWVTLRLASELLHPVFMAQHDHGFRRGGLVVRREGAADDGLDAEHGEEVVRDHADLHASRALVAEHRERHRVVFHDVADLAQLLAIVDDFLRGEGHVDAFQLLLLPQHDEAAVFVVRQASSAPRC